MLDIANFVVLIISVLTLYLIAKWTKLFSKKRYPPGPWGFPILGHLPFLGDKPEIKYLQWRRRYGDVVRIRLGNWNVIIVNGFEAIKDASERTDDVFSGRPELMSQTALLEAFHGSELFTFANFSPKYLQLRKRIASALKINKNICGYSLEDLFREETQILVEILLKYQNNEPVSMTSNVEVAVGRIVYQMLYGKGNGAEAEERVNVIVEALAVANKFAESSNIVEFVPWLRFIMKGKVEEFKNSAMATYRIVKANIEEHSISVQADYTRDVLDALLHFSKDLPEHGNKDCISKNDLLIQTVSLQAAGYDTTSRTMLFIILYLTAYPDVQDRVQKEIDDVLGCDKAVSWKDRVNLPYVNATIHEVMRMTSIVPFALPHYALQDTTLHGYDIDKGSVVLFNLHSVANEKSFWGDPEIFRPERLLNEDGKLDAEKCSHIISFGSGRRRCVGEMIAKMGVFIMTTTLMQRCSFKKAAGCDLTFEPIRGLVMSPKPYHVIVQKK